MSGLLIAPPPAIMLQLQKGLWVNALDIVIVTVEYSPGMHPESIKIMLRNGEPIKIIPARFKAAKTHDEAQCCLEEDAARFVEHINHAALVYIGATPHVEPKFKPSGS